MINFLLLSLALTTGEQKSIYKSMDSSNIDAQIAYSQLFPNSPEGRKALARAWQLLGSHSSLGIMPPLSRDIFDQLANFKPAALFDEKTLCLIEKLAQNLPNRKLKGHYVKTWQEILELPVEEIEISRGLLLEDDIKRRSYEAALDLLALKALAKLPQGLNSLPEKKIEAINQLVFFDMAMRYPPLSLSEKHIDSYSSLGAVLDSSRGICLGTSFVYLAIGERIGLPLEIITPPGHIYVRSYDHKGCRINIETTARGVDISDRHYQSINVKALQLRNNREAVGLIFFNEASVYLRSQEFDKALACYEKAEIFVKNDATLMQLKGMCLALTGQKKAALKYLQDNIHLKDNTQIDQLTLAEDYLKGAVNEETLRIFFMESKPSRESLGAKCQLLKEALKKNPAFREGLLELTDIYLKLNQTEFNALVKKMNLIKGCGQEISKADVEFLLTQFPNPTKKKAGGSVANTIAGIATLGGKTGFL
ncbi:MAG: transglutaminase family protein, partial [Chlamydiota bacterium]